MGATHSRGARRGRTGLRSLVACLATAGFLIAGASSASAAPEEVYDNIPDPQPGNVSSWGYEATSTSEFGGQIALDGTARDALELTVLMSSWGCESGTWNGGDCSTTTGATFTHDITANIYEVGTNNEPGTLVDSITQTFAIPYRPSASAECTNGRWFDGTTCYNGYATPITFDASDVAWPDEVIVTLAYNTTHYGDEPIGSSASCFTTDGGCGYDALNVGLNGAPSTGTTPLPADAYLDSTSAGSYCDGGTGGTGSLRLDSGCWAGFQPAFRVTAAGTSPASADECKKGGWASFDDPTFRNQGDCVSWVRNGK